jgi:hypothetical protein
MERKRNANGTAKMNRKYYILTERGKLSGADRGGGVSADLKGLPHSELILLQQPVFAVK